MATSATTTETGTGLVEVAERYLATWNETDPTTRRRSVEQLGAPEGRYIDPLAAATGREAIDAILAAVQGQFPALRFRLP
jgi:SnoaL-like domain